MKKRLFIVTLIFISLMFNESGKAEPFLDQWQWDNPRRVGEIKIIDREFQGYRKKFIFSRNGRLIEEQLLNNQRKIILKNILSYDKNDDLFLIERYQGNGDLLVKEKAVYINREIKLLVSSKDSLKGKFLYADNGFLKKITVYDSNNAKVAKYLFAFNEFGNLAERQSLNATDEIREREVLFYNEKKFPAGRLIYTSDGSLLRKDIYRYDYDRKGNWIQKIIDSEVYVNNERSESPSVVERQKITYFAI